MTGPSDRTESRRLTELTELLRDSVQEPSATDLQEGLNALRARTALSRPRPQGARRLLLAAAVLCSVALGVASLVYFREGSSSSERPVAVDKIEGGEILDGGYLSEVGHTGIRLLFNEGSKFDLAPGTRGRLRAVSADGARLAIEHGEASFQITERPNHRWLVEAGPFVVTVRGTVFAVVWDPANEELEVRLKRGRVAVSGPVVGDELLLRSGQTLSVSLPRGETVIKEGRSTVEPRAEQPAPAASGGPSEPAAPSASAAPSIGEQQLGEAPAPSASASAGPPGARWWKEAIATGQWDRILADVDREGVTATLQSL
ncbi:MAG TPA: FecR domain-containing protein, partial [Polyangiaceae bacterium]|nr:FecR domain-containing protein [Polyangiaceae bacterium]